jgi:transposase
VNTELSVVQSCMDTNERFCLPAAGKAVLRKWLRSTTTNNGTARRATVLIALDQGDTPTQVSRSLGLTRKTVYKWKGRYLADGIEGLSDKPRPGQPSKITDVTIKKVLNLSTEYLPQEATQWSIALMAEYAQVTHWQVRQIWNAFRIKPHLSKTFKISSDPEFAEKVVDIVGLYMDPPNNAVVLSIDEKTQIQALDRTQPGLPLGPGRVGSHTHDYKRHGTAALFAAFNVANGKVMAKVTNRTRSKEFLSFLKQVNRSVAKDKELHIILDNLSAHKTKAVMQWLEDNPRVHFHYTPTSSSWINAVEGWFSQLERRALYRGVFKSVPELKRALEEFVKTHNKLLAKPFQWTKSAKQILASVERAKKVLPN